MLDMYIMCDLPHFYAKYTKHTKYNIWDAIWMLLHQVLLCIIFGSCKVEMRDTSISFKTIIAEHMYMKCSY